MTSTRDGRSTPINDVPYVPKEEEFDDDSKHPFLTIPTIGAVLIAFACLFISVFASTWGPTAWAVTSEIYPSKHRSQCVSYCAASNWLFNFSIGFATPFIVSDIGMAYGYLFAACNFLAIVVVYFFLPETSGRSLEETDTIFLMQVKPWKSSGWELPVDETISSTDRRASEAYASRRGSRVYSAAGRTQSQTFAHKSEEGRMESQHVA